MTEPNIGWTDGNKGFIPSSNAVAPPVLGIANSGPISIIIKVLKM